MEFAPVLREVERPPAARDLGEVGCSGREPKGGEEGRRREGAAAFWSEFHRFLVIEADAKEGLRFIRVGTITEFTGALRSTGSQEQIEAGAYR